VFAGGFTWEAAAAVCADEQVDEFEVFDQLAHLVDKSLVLTDEQSGEIRYRLLETIRQYGAAKLRKEFPDEEPLLRERHRDWYLQMAEEAEPALLSGAQEQWLTSLEREHDNMRAALAWSVERAEGESALRLAGALWRFWSLRGYMAEGRERLSTVLGLPGAVVRTAHRAKVLHGAGRLAFQQGDYAAARRLFEESLDIRRELQDGHGIADSLNALGRIAMVQGDYGTAQGLYEASRKLQEELGNRRGLADSLSSLGDVARRRGEYKAAWRFYERGLLIRRELDDPRGVADSLQGLGNVAVRQGEHRKARALYGESLSIQRQLGVKRGIAGLLNNLASLAEHEEDYAEAHRLIEESLTLYRELGDRQQIALALHNLGEIALRLDDSQRARELCCEGLILFAEQHNKPGVADCLERLGEIAIRQGEAERAARLLGAVEALRESLGGSQPPDERADWERHVAAIRATLDETTFAGAWAQGRQLTVEQAIEEALPLGDLTLLLPGWGGRER
jgi:non-specific serine/threonine protein kinase